MSTQSREYDLNEFFAHEIQSVPPSISDFGNLYLPTNKAGILQCLKQPSQAVPPTQPTTPNFWMARSFFTACRCPLLVSIPSISWYADDIFLPYPHKQFGNAKRLDIVWDTYISDSLKESTGEKRVEGIRRKVSGNTKLPRNWFDFLRDSINKKKLFEFLTAKVVKYNWPLGKNVYITSGAAVALSGLGSPMEDCNHEEADTRMMVHILYPFITKRGKEYLSLFVLWTQMWVSSLLAYSMTS